MPRAKQAAGLRRPISDTWKYCSRLRLLEAGRTDMPLSEVEADTCER